jgi:tRNA-splicing ligase RtcB
VIDDFAAKGLSREHPDRHSTLRFRYSDTAPVQVPHLDDNGVNAALSVLDRHEIVRPVARLRPFAVLN